MDPCGDIVSRIAIYGGSSITVPALSELLGVKATTLNARFRRKQIPVHTIGRTNYLLHDQALQLIELHRYALIGWPTLLEASRITKVKPGTLKAWCDKGQLEAHRDLTKRLRLNPTELERRCLVVWRKQAKLTQPRLGTRAKLPIRRKIRQAQSPNNTQGLQPNESSPSAHYRFDLPIAPEPKVRILKAEDYGIGDLESRPETVAQRTKRSECRPIKPTHLVYDPLKPFPLSVCSPGKAITYGQYVGTILRLIDDPFNPKIKVAFPKHDHPEMREVLLVVGKKTDSEFSV